MPSCFHSVLLATALAGFANAQVFLNLEDDQFYVRTPANEESQEAESNDEPLLQEHRSADLLSHHYDYEDTYEVEEQQIRDEKVKHF